MLYNPENLFVNEDGTYSIGQPTGTNGIIKANVAVWYRSNPAAMDKLRCAKIFSSIATRHSPAQLKMLLEAGPQIQQTFCLSVDNIIVVFSATFDENLVHLDTVLQMLGRDPMFVDFKNLYMGHESCYEAGLILKELKDRKAYVVVNAGAMTDKRECLDCEILCPRHRRQTTKLTTSLQCSN